LDEFGQPTSYFMMIDAATKHRGNHPKLGTKQNKDEIGGKQQSKFECRMIGVDVRCGPVDTMFYYTTDNLQKGGANVMIEVLRQALIDLDKILETHQMHLPLTGTHGFDNCSENKNQFLFGFLSVLVELNYLAKVILCFLVVGHTHCPIDQTFGVVSTFIKKCEFIPTPPAFHHVLRFGHNTMSPPIVRALEVSTHWLDR
jgi:hypothetical protein